ncbi:MAG: autotransporter-associated beta strand repeat-containing protein [Pirellulales bacterium]|nr:autotransporter-associated beta strand repeat-containing protein [Pirellulales bacterium]
MRSTLDGVKQVCRWTVLALAAAVLTPILAPAQTSFDWTSFNGQSWLTSVKNQGTTGACWSFASCGALEAKYMLTRNDNSFQPDVSEQHLIDVGTLGGLTGGWSHKALDFFTSTGVVSEAESPWTGTYPSSGWPLMPGWPSRVWQSTSNQNFIGTSVNDVKNYLMTYGPMVMTMDANADWYIPPPGTSNGLHDVVVVGFQDTMAAPGGGYWIVKNSWGTTWPPAGNPPFSGTGYGAISYAARPTSATDVSAIDGAVYYTGPMYNIAGTDYTGTAATATWADTGAGNWDLVTANWLIGGTPFTWLNQEVQAVFNGVDTSPAINITSTAIAHGLTFLTPGYSISGGPLTVTAGGIYAYQSATINSPLTIGGPQIWHVAVGMSLNVTGPVHTVISDVTVTGAGNATISGNIDGGGVINAAAYGGSMTTGGAAPGSLIMLGAGNLNLTGASNVCGSLTVNNGNVFLGPNSTLTTTNNSVTVAAPGGTNAALTMNGGCTVNTSSMTVGTGSGSGNAFLTMNAGDAINIQNGTFNGAVNMAAANVTMNGNSSVNVINGTFDFAYVPAGQLADPGPATWTMNNNSSLTVNYPPSSFMGFNVAYNQGVAQWTLAGTSNVNVTCNAWWGEGNVASNATLDMFQNAAYYQVGDLSLGSVGTALFNLNDAALLSVSQGWVYVGNSTTGMANVNLQGGTFSHTDPMPGAPTSKAIAIGCSFGNGAVRVGESPTAAPGLVTCNNGIIVGMGGIGALDMNVGGTVSTPYVSSLAGGNGTVNFKGGTLQAAGNDPPGAHFVGTYDLWGTSAPGILNVMVFAGGATIDTVSPGFNVSVAVPLQDGDGLGGGLTVKGDGTLTLLGGSNYTGDTVIDSGTLQLGDGIVDGSVIGDIVNHSNLVYNNASDQNYAGVISGGGVLIKNGPGNLTLSGQNSYSGDTLVMAGILALDATGDLHPDSSILLGPGTVFSVKGGMPGTPVTHVTGPIGSNPVQSGDVFVGDDTDLSAPSIRCSTLIIGGPAPLASGNVAPVPEPGTPLLLAMAAAAVLLTFRRRRG